MSNISDNKRIAKNTILLYFRMFLMMAITLYTSRVILEVLGVDDYGIYNVLAGFVSMFGMISGTLSIAINRFITFELGKGNKEKLSKVFATSQMVLLIMSIAIAVLGIIIGVWFLNYHMVLPVDRKNAALWVLLFSLVTFVVNLISVPYNAVITAHEKMSAFAYISLLEAVLKLAIVYGISLTTVDKLIAYVVLLTIIQIIIRLIYSLYSRYNFEECRTRTSFDRKSFREIWSFTGWNIIGNGAYTMSTQGVNMIMNVFFGVSINAARGIALQINGAVQQFVINFTMAINPQITKSYASANYQRSYNLVCMGARFSFFLMLCIGLPLILEIDSILKIWLIDAPKYADTFSIWTIVTSFTVVLGQTLVTLMMANGDTKKYQLTISLFSILPFPISWLAYYFGASVVWSYIIFFVIFYIIVYVRLWLVHNLTGIPYKLYLKNVILRTHMVCVTSAILPFCYVYIAPQDYFRIVVTTVLSVVSVGISTFFWGINNTERAYLKQIINKRLLKWEK